MIALLCPTRQRPEQCKRLYQSIKDTTEYHVNHPAGCPHLYIGADAKDTYDYKYTHAIDAYDWVNFPDGMPTSHKWNVLAKAAMRQPWCNLFMLSADDMVFTTPGWDKAVIDHYNALPEGRKQHVYALQDSRDENGTPHIIVTREWIETMGYFVPPIFLHWFIDSWTVEIAKSADCFTHLKDYGLAHIKPSDEGKPDETHSRIRQWGWHERDKYVAETCKDWLELQKQKLGRYSGRQIIKTPTSASVVYL